MNIRSDDEDIDLEENDDDGGEAINNTNSDNVVVGTIISNEEKRNEEEEDCFALSKTSFMTILLVVLKDGHWLSCC